MFQMNNGSRASIVLLCLLLVVLAITNYLQQREKEFLYKLLTDSQNQEIERIAWHYRGLKDISCSFAEGTKKEREYIDMYMAVYVESINRYLSEEYVSATTKEKLRDAIDYVPCDCRDCKT